MKHSLGEIVWCRMAWRLGCFLAIILLPLSARCETEQTGPGAASSLTIDDSQSPIITLTADHISVADILTALSTRLGFAIERVPTDLRQTVTTTLKGELDDILRSDVLGRLNFLLIGEGSHIERLVLIGPEPSTELASASASAAPMNPMRPNTGSPGSAMPPASFAAQPQANAPALAATSGKVAQLLRAQAMQGPAQSAAGVFTSTMPAAIPNQGSASSAGAAIDATTAGGTAMGTAVRTALINVSNLSAALRSVCVGPACAH